MFGGECVERVETSLPHAMEEMKEFSGAPDLGILEHFDDVLQFVANQCHELATVRPPRIHENAQETIRAGNRERQVQTGSSPEPARAFFDVDQTVRRIDRLDEMAEGLGAFEPFSDGVPDERAFGTDAGEGL